MFLDVNTFEKKLSMNRGYEYMSTYHALLVHLHMY